MQEMYYKLFEHSYCMYLSLTSIVLASALHPHVPLKKKKKLNYTNSHGNVVMYFFRSATRVFIYLL